MPKIMKTADEISVCHDILDDILNNPEIENLFDWTNSADIRSNIISIKRTLCWILGHYEGRWLEENMKAVNEALKAKGFELKRIH
jgi:hypothetical protein